MSRAGERWKPYQERRGYRDDLIPKNRIIPPKSVQGRRAGEIVLIDDGKAPPRWRKVGIRREERESDPGHWKK